MVIVMVMIPKRKNKNGLENCLIVLDCTFIQILWRSLYKDNEMGGTRNMHEKSKKSTKNLITSLEGKI
jgi:hypothetical protein